MRSASYNRRLRATVRKTVSRRGAAPPYIARDGCLRQAVRDVDTERHATLRRGKCVCIRPVGGPECLPPRGRLGGRPWPHPAAAAQRFTERPRTRGTFVGVLPEALQQHRLEIRRDGASQTLRRGHRVGVKVMTDDLCDGHGFEHGAAGDQEVAHRTERVEIASRITRIGRSQRLRRQVQRRAGEHPRRRDRRSRIIRRERMHETEVDHLRDIRLTAALGEYDVRRLDVAVDETPFVRFDQCPAHLVEDREHPPTGLCAVQPDEIFEIDAVEILHGVIEDAVRRAPVVVDRDRVRMAQLRSDLHLALESHEACLTRAIGRQQLDGRRPPQHGVAGAVDDPHAPGADLALERVLSELPHARRFRPQTEDDRGNPPSRPQSTPRTTSSRSPRRPTNRRRRTPMRGRAAPSPRHSRAASCAGCSGTVIARAMTVFAQARSPA